MPYPTNGHNLTLANDLFIVKCRKCKLIGSAEYFFKEECKGPISSFFANSVVQDNMAELLSNSGVVCRTIKQERQQWHRV